MQHVLPQLYMQFGCDILTACSSQVPVQTAIFGAIASYSGPKGATTDNHVRVRTRNGQQQRLLGRILGYCQVDVASTGWLHLGLGRSAKTNFMRNFYILCRRFPCNALIDRL
jgi:hypothetical protein